MIKVIIIFALIFSLPILWGIILKQGVSRKVFASISSLSMALVYFLLFIIFATRYRFISGSILFLLVSVIAYPTAYFLHPIIIKLQTRKKLQ